MRSPEYTLTVAAHGAVATVALAVGLVALVTRKGGARHRQAGRGYGRAIAAVVVTGALLLALGRATLYLATLLLLTAYPTWSGMRVLGRKRPDARRDHRAARADWVVAAATLALAVGCVAATALGYGAGNAGPIRGFAGFVAAMAAYDLWRFARPGAWPMRPQLWLREHIGKLVGAYFGAVSAFSGNVFTFVPDPWRVLVPNLLGVAVMTVFLVRVRRARPTATRAGALTPAPAATA